MIWARACALSAVALCALALAGCSGETEALDRPTIGVAELSTRTIVSQDDDGGVGVHLHGATLRQGIEAVAATARLSVMIEPDVPETRLYVSFRSTTGAQAIETLAKLCKVTHERESLRGVTVHRIGAAPSKVFASGPWPLVKAALIIAAAFFSMRAFQAYLRRRERDSREGAKRLSRLGPLIRTLTWIGAALGALLVTLKVSPTAAFALTGGGLLLFGLASRELTANLLAGLTIAIDRPLHVGDFVEVGSQRGEVTSVGLRSTQLVTPDDSVVTLPNHLISDHAVTSANYGEVHALVEIEFFVAHNADVSLARTLVWEGLITSAYCAWQKPARVFVREQERSTQIVGAAYVFDVRQQRRFVTDVTHRVKEAFAKAELPYPRVRGETR